MASAGPVEFHNNSQYIHTQETWSLLDNLFYAESHGSYKLPHCRAFLIKLSCQKWYNYIHMISVKTLWNSAENCRFSSKFEFSSGLKLYSEESTLNNFLCESSRWLCAVNLQSYSSRSVRVWAFCRLFSYSSSQSRGFSFILREQASRRRSLRELRRGCVEMPEGTCIFYYQHI